MTSDERQAFANQAERALTHDLVKNVIEEAILNHGEKPLLRYSLMKVAMYTATVARAQALGIDPDELRNTPDEAEAQGLARARAFVAAGKPAFRFDESGMTRLD